MLWENIILILYMSEVTEGKILPMWGKQCHFLKWTNILWRNSSLTLYMSEVIEGKILPVCGENSLIS